MALVGMRVPAGLLGSSITAAGDIDEKELKIAMKALGFDPSDEEVAQMIGSLDTDGGGTIDFNEFKVLMGGKIVTPHPRSLPHQRWVLIAALDR